MPDRYEDTKQNMTYLMHLQLNQMQLKTVANIEIIILEQSNVFMWAWVPMKLFKFVLCKLAIESLKISKDPLVFIEQFCGSVVA